MVLRRIKVSRVFIDSSVLIAAAISSSGSARDLILSSIRNESKLVVSDLVFEETERNLSQKAPKALPAFKLFKEVLSPELVNAPKLFILKASKVVNVKDAPIVAAALEAKADFLVTYDRKHLLRYKGEVEREFKIKVRTPGEVMNEIK